MLRDNVVNLKAPQPASQTPTLNFIQHHMYCSTPFWHLSADFGLQHGACPGAATTSVVKRRTLVRTSTHQLGALGATSTRTVENWKH